MATLINDLETYVSDEYIEKPNTQKQVKFVNTNNNESDNESDNEYDNNVYISYEIYESFKNIKKNFKNLSLKKIIVFSFIIFIVSNNYINTYILDNLQITNSFIQNLLIILISLFIYIFF